MKILLLGKTGQVGGELLGLLSPTEEVIAWDRASADLEDLEGLEDKVGSLVPSVIVNAAAYTAVDRAESEPARAYRVNAEAVEVLARYARASGACLVHYSTDYVFDGTRGKPYIETDTTNPLSVYGKSKLAGEEALRKSGCRHYILRTSWIFAATGQNFPRTILRLATERRELRVVDDQVGAPTSARLVAQVTRDVLRLLRDDPQSLERTAGTYHLSASGETTWYDYARYIVTEAARLGFEMRLDPSQVIPVPSAEYPQAAARPLDSRLDSNKLESWLGIALPTWQTGVGRVVGALVSQRTRA